MGNTQRCSAFFTPTPLVGRTEAISEVVTLLGRSDVRLVTLTGAPGIGKTVMSLHIAAAMAAHVDAVYVANLATSHDPSLVAASIAQVLSVADTGTTDVVERIAWAIGDQRVLLVLDNFEHVLPAASLISQLLAACPDLTTLVTSRAALRIRGEREYPVPPLTLPPADYHRTVSHRYNLSREHFETIEASSAVQLFVQRAQAVRPDFDLTETNAGAVAAICQRLDGVPLAIELVAARSRLFPPQALLARMERKLLLLSDGPRDLPPRQQTLYNAIAWSYQLLDDPARRLFEQLSVFAGGCTLDAMSTVVGNGSHADETIDTSLLDGIEQLVEHSMLRSFGSDAADLRLVMLEIIREFARDRLESRGEVVELSLRHARYCMDLVTRAAPELCGVRQGPWLQRLDVEYDNIRAALAWCLNAPDEVVEAGTIGLQLAGALWWYWTMRSRFTEGRRWLEQCIERYPDAPIDMRCDALTAAGKLAEYQGDPEHADVLLTAALTLARAIGHPLRIADAELYLCRADRDRGKYTCGRERGNTSLKVFEQHGTLENLIWAHLSLGDIEVDQGNADEAATHYEWALQSSRQNGTEDCAASALCNLGTVAALRGEVERANQLYEQSRVQFEASRNKGCVGEVHILQGRLAITRGDLERAEFHFRIGLTELLEMGRRHLIALGMEGLGAVEAARCKPEQAVKLFACADGLRKQVGAPRRPIDRGWYDDAFAMARAQLSDDAWARAWAVGEQLHMEEVLNELPESSPSAPFTSHNTSMLPAEPGSPSQQLVRLTPRERQVIRLIAQGFSNRAIASELVITERTAEIHVSNILGKLSLSSRAHAAAYAVSHGLVSIETLSS